jgi:exonuclease SbcD
MNEFIITHTSDWHLGKKLYKEGRHDEHQLFLDWLTQDLKDSKTNLLVIAGDIFDSPIPTTQALEQYYQFLYHLTQETSCQVLIIGGNHDNGRFLEAPKNFLAGHRIHLAGKFQQSRYYQFTGSSEIALFALPFFKVSDFVFSSEIDLKTTILEKLQNEFQAFNEFAQKQGAKAKILVAHHMLVNASVSGSENAVGLSGLEYLPIKLLEDYFDLVLMGHIHQKQILGSEKKCFYSGSPLPMRFSERGPKFAFRHRINDLGKISSEAIEIPQARGLWSLDFTTLADLEKDIEKAPTSYPLGHFAELRIDKSNHYPGLGDDLKKLFSRYPSQKLISCKFTGSSDSEESTIDAFELDPKELFLRFFRETYPSEDPSPELLEDFSQLLAQLEDSGTDEMGTSEDSLEA